MSTEFNQIPVEIREDAGKGASRRLRREGKVPAIIYGGEREPVSLQIPVNFLRRAEQDEAFYTSLLEIHAGDDKRQQVILRDLQRHPVRGDIMHVDFQRVSDKETMRISVPLHFLGEEKSPAGKTAGVVVSHQMNEVEILCLPKDLPEFIEVDLSALEPGDVVQIGSLKLPKGVEIAMLAHDDAETAAELPVATAVRVNVQTTTASEDDAVAADDVPASEQDDGASADGKESGDD